MDEANEIPAAHAVSVPMFAALKKFVQRRREHDQGKPSIVCSRLLYLSKQAGLETIVLQSASSVLAFMPQDMLLAMVKPKLLPLIYLGQMWQADKMLQILSYQFSAAHQVQSFH